MARYGRQGWFGHGSLGRVLVRQARRGGARRVVVRLGGAWHGYFIKIEEYKQEEIINGF